MRVPCMTVVVVVDRVVARALQAGIHRNTSCELSLDTRAGVGAHRGVGPGVAAPFSKNRVPPGAPPANACSCSYCGKKEVHMVNVRVRRAAHISERLVDHGRRAHLLLQLMNAGFQLLLASQRPRFC